MKEINITINDAQYDKLTYLYNIENNWRKMWNSDPLTIDQYIEQMIDGAHYKLQEDEKEHGRSDAE